MAMKQQHLSDEERLALTEYRFQRAKDTLAEVETMIAGSFFNAAVNRLYYACYYAVVALLIQNGIEAQTHNGVKQMFSLHFIANGKIEKKYATFYSQLFSSRITGDYDDFVVFDKATVEPLYEQAKGFIHTIEKVISIA
jgi:uncharacterized protein (UPF0332 family)